MHAILVIFVSNIIVLCYCIFGDSSISITSNSESVLMAGEPEEKNRAIVSCHMQFRLLFYKSCSPSRREQSMSIFYRKQKWCL